IKSPRCKCNTCTFNSLHIRIGTQRHTTNATAGHVAIKKPMNVVSHHKQ
ncbi:hypothetical protein CpipJ_CPIJ010961, partial [Culex quinquefasciatus]